MGDRERPEIRTGGDEDSEMLMARVLIRLSPVFVDDMVFDRAASRYWDIE